MEQAAALVLGVLLDLAFGDPPNRWHPVAWLGAWARWLERHAFADARSRGLLLWLLAAFPFVAAAAMLQAAGVWGEAIVLWLCLGARSLHRAVEEVLTAPDLPTMRTKVARIVSRDVEPMDAEDAARAALESLAENFNDAAIASIFWFAIGSAPAAALHRAANTLDALWGDPRYRRFGWAAARIDDLLGWVPARLSAWLLLMAGSLCGCGRWALGRLRAQAKTHPSPNAGLCEAALAWAATVKLGGPVVRSGARQERPWYGPEDARSPQLAARDAQRVVRTSYAIGCALGVGFALL